MNTSVAEQKEEVIEFITCPEGTEQIEGEIEDTADNDDGVDYGDELDEEDSDFEQDFDSYFNDTNENDTGPLLEIENDAHFVLVNDDELFDVTPNKNEDDNFNNGQPDEWLMV